MVTLDEFVAWESGPFGGLLQAARMKIPDFDSQKENSQYVDIKVAYPGRFGPRTVRTELITIPFKEYLARIDRIHEGAASNPAWYKREIGNIGGMAIPYGGFYSRSYREELSWVVKHEYWDFKHRNWDVRPKEKLTEEELKNIVLDLALDDALMFSYHRKIGSYLPIYIFLPGENQFSSFSQQLRERLPAGMQIGEELLEKKWFGGDDTEHYFYSIGQNQDQPYTENFKVPKGQGEIRQWVQDKYKIKPPCSNLVEIHWRGNGRSYADLIKAVAEVIQEFSYDTIFGIFRDRETINLCGGVFYKPEKSGNS